MIIVSFWTSGHISHPALIHYDWVLVQLPNSFSPLSEKKGTEWGFSQPKQFGVR